MKNILVGNVKIIYDLFVKHGELTDNDLALHAPQINPNSIRGARLRLQKMKIIESLQEKKFVGIPPNVKCKNNRAGYFTVYKLCESHAKKQSNKNSKSSDINEACAKVMHSLMELIKIVAKSTN